MIISCVLYGNPCEECETANEKQSESQKDEEEKVGGGVAREQRRTMKSMFNKLNRIDIDVRQEGAVKNTDVK